MTAAALDYDEEMMLLLGEMIINFPFSNLGNTDDVRLDYFFDNSFLQHPAQRSLLSGSYTV